MTTKGDRYVSNLTGLTMVVTSATKKEITVEVQRRVTSRQTGEIKIEARTRVVPMHLWALVVMNYVKDLH